MRTSRGEALYKCDICIFGGVKGIGGMKGMKKIMLALLFTSMSLAVMPIASGKGMKRIPGDQMTMKN